MSSPSALTLPGSAPCPPLCPPLQEPWVTELFWGGSAGPSQPVPKSCHAPCPPPQVLWVTELFRDSSTGPSQPVPIPIVPWPVWGWLEPGYAPAVPIPGRALLSKQLWAGCARLILRGHFGKSCPRGTLPDFHTALRAPKCARGDERLCNIDGAVLEQHTLYPVRAAQLTPPPAHLSHCQMDLHIKNVLYLHANHRHLPSQWYLEHTMRLVYPNTILSYILPSLELIILFQPGRFPPTGLSQELLSSPAKTTSASASPAVSDTSQVQPH